MAEFGTLLNCEEAQRLIEETQDPVTRNMLNMAYIHFVKEHFFTGSLKPSCNVDMAYVVAMLKGFLSEHEVLTRSLSGEKVGAWFDEVTEESEEGKGDIHP